MLLIATTSNCFWSSKVQMVPCKLHFLQREAASPSWITKQKPPVWNSLNFPPKIWKSKCVYNHPLLISLCNTESAFHISKDNFFPLMMWSLIPRNLTLIVISLSRVLHFFPPFRPCLSPFQNRNISLHSVLSSGCAISEPHLLLFIATV